jgi:hypothetical protein
MTAIALAAAGPCSQQKPRRALWGWRKGLLAGDSLLRCSSRLHVDMMCHQLGVSSARVATLGWGNQHHSAILKLRITNPIKQYEMQGTPGELVRLGMAQLYMQVLKQEFAPLEGYDVTKLPYPRHQLPGARIKGFPMKPYALLHSR